MAELDVESRENDKKDNNKKNTNWWIWAVVVIIVIIVAWVAMDNRTDVQREETPVIDTSALIEELTSDSSNQFVYIRLHRKK